jgi:hypothetical protein
MFYGQLISTQLRKLAFKIVNSSTLLLPAWKKLLATLHMDERLMPRDVKTRWNSTFSMLDFAVEYRKPLDMLSGQRGNGLREFELTQEEWEIAEQLRDVLKVGVRYLLTRRQFTRSTRVIRVFLIDARYPDFLRCDCILLKSDPKSCHSDTGYGPH